MTARLRRAASGARHLRWGREIHATLDAHVNENDQITEEQKTALISERDSVAAWVGTLGSAVAEYRGWIDTAHVGVRASLRVANYLADEAETTTRGTLLPYESAVSSAIPGGVKSVFSGLTMSRVLRAGNARAARIARAGATALSTISGTHGLPDLTPLATRLDTCAVRIEGLLKRQSDEIEPQRRPLKLAVERAVLELRDGLDHMDARLRASFTPAFIESLYPQLSSGAAAVADEDEEELDDTETPIDSES